jgi:hypothetical protein
MGWDSRITTRSLKLPSVYGKYRQKEMEKLQRGKILLGACCKNGDRTFEFRGPVPVFATGSNRHARISIFSPHG